VNVLYLDSILTSRRCFGISTIRSTRWNIRRTRSRNRKKHYYKQGLFNYLSRRSIIN